MSRDITIGPWKQDEYGRWYRMVGNCKEYRTEMITSTGTIYADQAGGHADQIRAQQERERIQQEEKRIQQNELSLCPFRKSGYADRCRGESCAWYDGKGCAIASGSQGGGVGLACPISSRSCRKECALYADGCMMVRR